jgi:hypothetical protein
VAWFTAIRLITVLSALSGPTLNVTSRHLQNTPVSFCFCLSVNNFCSNYISKILSVNKYEGVSESFRTGRLERELQIIQLSAITCSCIAILWVSLVSFSAITLCIASQRVIPKVSVYFVIDSVRKLLDTTSYWKTSDGETNFKVQKD